jgi:hypothetical protein
MQQSAKTQKGWIGLKSLRVRQEKRKRKRKRRKTGRAGAGKASTRKADEG